MKQLPYRAATRTGDVFDFTFPLHPDTGNAVQISQMISDVLGALDRALAIGAPASNGDVLQALAMAMAVRARMIHAPTETSGRLALDLLASALEAAEAAPRQGPTAGHA